MKKFGRNIYLDDKQCFELWIKNNGNFKQVQIELYNLGYTSRTKKYSENYASKFKTPMVSKTAVITFLGNCSNS